MDAACGSRRWTGALPLHFATLAQLVEHLFCNQGVVGSNPTGGTSRDFDLQYKAEYQRFVRYLETVQVVVTATDSDDASTKFEEDEIDRFLVLQRDAVEVDEETPVFIPVINDEND